MSGFKKPQDISSNKIADSGDDVMYLLNLEIYKRFKDDEANIRRQVDEHERQYQECLYQYHTAFSKYIKLLKLAKTRCILEQNNNFINNKLIEESKQNILRIKTIMNRSVIDKLDENALRELRNHLSNQDVHSNLKDIKADLINNSEVVKAIQSAQENIENQLETAVLQGLDSFVDEFKL